MDGFTPDTAGANEDGFIPDQPTQPQNPKGAEGGSNLLQNISGALENLGLGAIPHGINSVGNDVGNFIKNPSSIGAPSFLQRITNPNLVSKGNQFYSPQAQVAQNQNPGMQEVKDLAGEASWMVPETKLLKGTGIVAKAVNLALQGGLQGGLQATSQEGATPESVIGGAATGAGANPALAGAGNVLTEQLPKYLGFRAYGKAGLKLPDVLKAQRQYGTEDLKGVRDFILESSKGTTTKEQLLQPILDMAKQPEWVGTPGLSEMTRTGSVRTGIRHVESGAVKDIKSALDQSSDAFDFYSRLKNMAYPKSGDSPAANRLAGFMRSAASNVREQIINGSDNPETTRKAMDTYAAQMAIKAVKNEKNMNTIVNKMSRYIPSGEAGLGVIGMIMAVPHLAPVAPFLLLDALTSNKYVAPKLAGGLTKVGQSGAGDVLRRLGVGGAVSTADQNQSNPQ